MKKVLIIFGTRPEAIKMCPLINQFKRHSSHFNLKVCVTAQHREMLDQVLNFFKIIPDYDLNLMKPGQNLYMLTSSIIESMKVVLDDFKPNFVFVHGDTTTTAFASIASFYNQIKICHIEAGLRTFNKYSPFPEEINRSITGRLADIHFAPTEQAANNLLLENIDKNSIVVTGNTVIDALLDGIEIIKNYKDEEIDKLKKIIDNTKKTILITGHRRENFGKGFENICNAILELSKNDNINLVYPVHLNPNVKDIVFKTLSNKENIHLINPLSYPAFIWLTNKSHIILTDSGGIQEEAPSLGIPVLVMRDNTERPEGVAAKTAILVGTKKEKIISNVNNLLNNKLEYEKISMKENPYGDGNASRTIMEHLINHG